MNSRNVRFLLAMVLMFALSACGVSRGGGVGDTGGNGEWTVQPGTSGDDLGYGIAVDSSGNVYATGSTGGGLDGNTSNGGDDIFITNYNTDGNRQWTVQPGTSEYERGFGIAVDSSGNVYATGYTKGGLNGNTNNGDADIFITKYTQ